MGQNERPRWVYVLGVLGPGVLGARPLAQGTTTARSVSATAHRSPETAAQSVLNGFNISP